MIVLLSTTYLALLDLQMKRYDDNLKLLDFDQNKRQRRNLEEKCESIEHKKVDRMGRCGFFSITRTVQKCLLSVTRPFEKCISLYRSQDQKMSFLS